ncbi:P-loop containing nucleoside triphosphate hydrolase protein [Scenedesmus sp. NREL 46B-D3]|nr:P-loop containing nucleoside triphosphate hydrolase protein [Scenedesmus sp. NREL 46B-D3]
MQQDSVRFAEVPPPQPRVVVVSGPSGVGKDAVIKRLQELRPDLYFVVTATSRAMRPGEVEGRDYFFVSKATFESWMHSGQLLEHALVYGEYKGIPRQQVDTALGKGSDVVLRIDVQGAETVRRLMPGVVSVFIVAESEAQLVARLVSRKTEPMDKMMTRVRTARDETQHISNFDYVVVNREGQLDDCVAQLCAIIDAEKLRTKQQL